MAGTRGNGAKGESSGSKVAEGEAGQFSKDHWEDLLVDTRTPLYAAEHSGRYERQKLIRGYEAVTERNLIAVVDQIYEGKMTVFQELLGDCDSSKGLDVLLASPGGSGEMALRMVQSMQNQCENVRVIVPDMAKSAATVLCLGADEIIMGPAGDLGPIDPQMILQSRFMVSAKELVKAVDDAEAKVQDNPGAFALYSALLSDVNMLTYEQSKSAINRSGTLMEEALAAVKTRTPDKVKQLSEKLKGPLIEVPTNHAAVFSFEDARRNGLPVTRFDSKCQEWVLLWALWTHYYALGCFPNGNTAIYEGERVSHIETPTGPID